MVLQACSKLYFPVSRLSLFSRRNRPELPCQCSSLSNSCPAIERHQSTCSLFKELYLAFLDSLTSRSESESCRLVEWQHAAYNSRPGSLLHERQSGKHVMYRLLAAVDALWVTRLPISKRRLYMTRSLSTFHWNSTSTIPLIAVKIAFCIFLGSTRSCGELLFKSCRVEP